MGLCPHLKYPPLRRGIFISEKKERKLSVPGGKAGLFPEDAYTSKE